MTAQQIFKLLTNKKFDYNLDTPCLQIDALNTISQNVTNIIYESLKQKSNSSNLKRVNSLKFLNGLCKVKQEHINILEDFEYHAKLEEHFKLEHGDVQILLTRIGYELEESYPNSLTEAVIAFYQRKKSFNAQRNKRLENIKQKDQEKMASKFNLQTQKYISSYEIDENGIRGILGDYDYRKGIETIRSTKVSSFIDRDKQIKLLYALINLNRVSDFPIIEKVLRKITKYDQLETFEENFLLYLWETVHIGSNYIRIFHDHFFFVVERIIIKIAIDLLQIENELEVQQFLESIKSDQNILKIRYICNENDLFYYHLRSLIFELYCNGNCNRNLSNLWNLVEKA